MIKGRTAPIVGVAARGPLLAVGDGDLADVCLAQSRPNLLKRDNPLLVILDGPGLSRTSDFLLRSLTARPPLPVNLERLCKRQFAFGSSRQGGGLLFLRFLEVPQAHFRHREFVGFKRFLNQLAAHSKPCKVGARWNVTDQVCALSGDPRFRARLHLFRKSSGRV